MPFLFYVRKDKNYDDMNEINTNNKRHTITIDHATFLRLKNKGYFDESYSQLISRLIDQAERVNNEGKTGN